MESAVKIRLHEETEKVNNFLHNNAISKLKKYVRGINIIDVAEIIRHLKPHYKTDVFNLFTLKEKADILAETGEFSRTYLLKHLKNEEIAEIIEHMHPDDAADILGRFTEHKINHIMSYVPPKESHQVSKLLVHHEESAGGLMTTEYISLIQSTTVDDAIKTLREAKHFDMQYIYVVDRNNSLVGVVSLKQLVLAKPKILLKSIMKKNVVYVRAGMDQERVAKIVAKYNLISVPVVDSKNKLLGVVTVDDIVDVIQEEATEDMFKMAGVDSDELLSLSAFNVAKARIPWIFTTLIGGLFAALIMGAFQATLTEIIALAFFVPLVMGIGGSVGIQSLTIVVRGLATGDIEIAKVRSLVFKQFKVGAIMGIFSGLFIGLITFLWKGSATPMLGLIVGLSMFLAVTVSTTTGALIPIMLKKAGVDPAIAANPFVSTFSDVFGLIIYFSMATFFIFVI